MSDKEIIFTVPMSGTCQFNNNTMKLLHNEPYVLIAKSERDALKSDYDALKKENEELSTSESEYQKVCEFIAKNFGDLSCCYDAEDVIGLAQSAVDRLKAKLEKAEKVIEFYADGDSWGHESPSSTSYSVIDKEDMGIGEFNLNELTDDDRVGGLRARKFLEENK